MNRMVLLKTGLLLLVTIFTSKLPQKVSGLAWSGLAYGCPAIQLIKPCTCSEITRGLEIVCEGVRLDALREVFETVQQTGQTLMYLKMKNNHMHTFPSYLLSKIDVRHLMAHKCSIELVDRSAFSGLEDKLESIDFSDNNFTQVPSSSLRNLSALVSLNLNFNEITSLEAEAFSGLHALLRLSLYGNRIASISPKAFAGPGLVNLTRINLGGNRLTSVPTEAIRPLSALQRFQLHENSISGALTSKDFSNLQSADSLDVLNLANNEIEKLEADIFGSLTTLNSIDFEANRITSIDANAFRGIEETLEWLKLGENKLTEVPRRALANVTKLRELDLRGNLIRVLRADDFASYGEKIKFLYLQKNRIDTIEAGVFDILQSIEWLNLHSNRLKRLPAVVYEKVLSNILILDVHDNPLICSCSLRWYPKWIQSTGNKNQKSLLDQDVSCSSREEDDGSTMGTTTSPPPASPPVQLANLDRTFTCGATLPHFGASFLVSSFLVLLLW